jgi:hypothetical protein
MAVKINCIYFLIGDICGEEGVGARGVGGSVVGVGRAIREEKVALVYSVEKFYYHIYQC